MDNFINLIEAFDFWGWIAVIAVVAIICQAFIVIKKMSIKHEERMAQITQGITPGSEDDAYKSDEL
ncbi:MAG: hypothetical protein GY869_12955 [Planctomycetes bacterium]|nr:hypothetical protein [Planctomycetota bacterium]